MTRFTKLAFAVAVIGLSACVPAKLPPLPSLPSLASVLPQPTPPVMRWDHRPEAAEWTTRSLAAIARYDDVLASRVPADIQAWCPGYEKNEPKDRRAFWAGLLSAVAKYESTWNPAASGGGGRYIGLMQISPKTAKNYGCTATSVKALKDGAANLECAVNILAHQVGRDGVVAGKGNRGIGRDWMPLRKSDKRSAMASWTASQTYCQ